ncbi:MAG: hypothetical protein NT096_15360 [Proteobacteria bacterium]|nr:hypothetical protein [Pseudomonadota bacterium]
MSTYQVGNFPIDWCEWNGKFRDTLRKFWKGNPGQIRDLGYRLTGSADLYGEDGRSPYNSINFITCHDGFTLNDLVSYNVKHNEANRENNNDGTNENNSWNCGAEGTTDDIRIINLRKQLIKNYVCHLLFSSGIPMILGGDEFMRTQRGNSNAYCQDNEISWFHWDYVKKNGDIVEFFKKAIVFTRHYAVLQQRKFFQGLDLDDDSFADITWYGTDLEKPAWDNPELRTLSYQIDGGEEKSDNGDYHLFFILNADSNAHKVKIPSPREGKRWYRAIDTSLRSGEDFFPPGEELLLIPSDDYSASPRSTVVLVGK